MACGYLVSVKARERRVWTPYRGYCGVGCARGLRSWAKAFASGAVTCGAREVLTACSRARIVEDNCRCSIHVGCVMIGVYMPKSKVRVKRRKAAKGRGGCCTRIPVRCRHEMRESIAREEIRNAVSVWVSPGGGADAHARFVQVIDGVIDGFVTSDGVDAPDGGLLTERGFKRVCEMVCLAASFGRVSSLLGTNYAVRAANTDSAWKRVVERCEAAGVPLV